jgi:predicted Rossmann fold nucleotide-binding protein DprA/Smf involved in DNA uptake
MQLSADGQAIALMCSGLALEGDRTIKPFSSTEWHRLSAALQQSELWDRPRELLGREPGELRDGLGVTHEAAERLARLLARGGQLAFAVDRLASRGIWVLTRADEAYPPRLKKLLLGNAPPVLYGAGPQGALREPSLAVVGSRDADQQQLRFARGIGAQCANQRVAVISGAARGVDLEAMLGALDAGGVAVGVTVDPLEKLIRRPTLRVPLSEETLTLVTPFHPAARWHAGNAMRRNRLVYVISQAAVVAASAAQSGGTWAGAIENLKHHWVPIYVRDDGSEGSRELARAGAHPLAPDSVETITVQSLFEAWSPTLLRENEPHATQEQPTVEDPDSPPVETVETVAAPASTDPPDAFTVIWPALQSYLQVHRSERDVAKALRLELSQARAWLKRAVQEDLASVQTRPRKRYLASEQLQLG